MTPDIGAVPRHIEGKITKDAYTQLIGHGAQRLPLLIQMPLHQPLGFESLLMACRPAAQRSAPMPRQPQRPLPPGLPLMLATQLHEHHMVLQPAGLSSTPSGKRSMALRGLQGPCQLQGNSQRIGPLFRQSAIQACIPWGLVLTR